MPNVRNLVLAQLVLLIFVSAIALCAVAQEPFLSKPQWTAIRDESSGGAPYENLRYLTTLHRVPATADFDQAAQFMLQRAREYGLADAHSEQFPIDGTKPYGLMRSYLGWNVEAGSLWEVSPQHLLLGDWKTDPIRLADYSHSANVEAPLIDVHDGTHEDDYRDKDVRGKIVLADGVLARVQALAVIAHGAAGIVSDMPNQTTAWSGLDPTLVRWGHLDARQPSGFAFMVSRQTAQALREQVQREQITLKAEVKATVGPGHWTVVTGTIPGSDPASGEIVYSCHLDHERPGANDNGSGCVTILESARVLARLIASGALPKPRRTLRFVWGPEVEGTMAFLATHPEIKQRLRVNIHMDMVGGDYLRNKSVFHVTATPWSLPSFVTDVGAAFLETIRTGATDYAGSGAGLAAAVVETRTSEQGTRNEFIADVTPYSAGSDHDDYDSSTIAVPSLYLRDWPDIYIHTDHDSLAQIDPTKLRRVALLGAASGYVYASVGAAQLPKLLSYLTAASETRLARTFQDAQRLVDDPALDANAAWYEARNLLTQALSRESAALHSLVEFTGGAESSNADNAKALAAQAATFNNWIDARAKLRGAQGSASVAGWAESPHARRVPTRVGNFGPLTYQNDNVLLARLGKDRYAKIKLLNSEATPLLNVQDQSELYAYEIVNLVNGKRTLAEIRDVVSAEYGPIPIELVADYLEACVDAKVVQWK
ncbi:MAG TPA: M28 family peptidase [Terriglobales bacterium]|jgi:aminopeptidase YwaD|nr:M28 family peptidase [Terriglobales bacterium]